MMSLDSRIDHARMLERQRAVRALLQQPLLSAAGPYAEEFGLVRRNAAWLRDWFVRYPGWSLHVDAEVARLRKVPADLSDGTRPAQESKGQTTFSRRRYIMLCFALAALERSERQTALGRLADQIVELSRPEPALAEAGMVLDWSNRDQRRDLVAAIRYLIELRVLIRVHGDEEQYLNDRGDVLYTINRPALAGMLSVRRGPSMVEADSLEERIFAIIEEPLPDTDEGRIRRLRSRVVRRLLDDPVVYYADLDSEERAYLHSQRGRLLKDIQTATGLVPEVRREGIAMLDHGGSATDLRMPEEGTDGHLTLLLAEFLSDQALQDESTVIGCERLHLHVAALIREHRRHWRKDVGEAGAEVALTHRVVERLEALKLVRRVDGGVVPLPALARYRAGEVKTGSEETLWGQE